jgi:hypothetical protein
MRQRKEERQENFWVGRVGRGLRGDRKSKVSQGELTEV